jgi:hypothetical protein
MTAIELLVRTQLGSAFFVPLRIKRCAATPTATVEPAAYPNARWSTRDAASVEA